MVNNQALRFVPGSKRSAARNALRYVSCTRSSASAGTRVSRSAVRYRLSSVRQRLGLERRARGRAPASDAAGLAVRMRMSPRAVGVNPGALRFIPAIGRDRGASARLARHAEAVGQRRALRAARQRSRPERRAQIVSPAEVSRRRGTLRADAGFARPLSTRLQGSPRHSKIATAPASSRRPRYRLCACASRCLCRPLPAWSLVARCRSASCAAAQTPFVPYFGKNNIHYDNFDWHIYKTDHFEIYYYPELEQHLERIAGYAESAYQQISADLKHDLSFKVPLILFKTHSEFEQQNVIPGAAQEGVGAFAEPVRAAHGAADRRAAGPALRPDRPRAHAQFEFDIIPQGLIRRSVPLWVNEGLSDYERGAVDAARPDDGPRRRGRRHRAEDDRARGLRQRRTTRA